MVAEGRGVAGDRTCLSVFRVAFPPSLPEAWPKTSILRREGVAHALVTADTGAPYGGQRCLLCPRRARDKVLQPQGRKHSSASPVPLGLEPNFQFPNAAASL